MDFTILSVTIVLIFFLIISYYLDVLKLSTPLVLIYLIFCFSYIIDEELVSKAGFDTENEISIENSKKILDFVNKSADQTKLNEKNSQQILDVSKPVVSSNPKPIIIDSNLMIQKDREKVVVSVPNDEKIVSKTKINDKEILEHSLMLNEVMICRGVYKRNPIKPGFTFTNNVDSLFCYTKISNKGTKQEIKHLWYFENKLITSVVYNIKTSHNYRSWSKKTILPSQVGDWRVDIVDKNEEVLGSREFQISTLNNAF